jgi:hypothetical protein
MSPSKSFFIMSVEMFFFIVTAFVAFIPTIWSMKKNTSKKIIGWKNLTLAGKIYIAAFAVFFGTGLYLTIKSQIESREKEINSAKHIKSDSTSMVNLTIKVTKLYSSDSTYKSAIKKGGFKYDSINGIIISPRINVQKIGKGGSGIQNNNSSIYGPQAGRDLIINGGERILNDQGISLLLEKTKKYKSWRIRLNPSIKAGATMVEQIREVLIENGYQVFPKSFDVTIMDSFDGMTFVESLEDKILDLGIGIIR